MFTDSIEGSRIERESVERERNNKGECAGENSERKKKRE